jgi:hypothetical protein
MAPFVARAPHAWLLRVLLLDLWQWPSSSLRVPAANRRWASYCAVAPSHLTRLASTALRFSPHHSGAGAAVDAADEEETREPTACLGAAAAPCGGAIGVLQRTLIDQGIKSRFDLQVRRRTRRAPKSIRDAPSA